MSNPTGEPTGVTRRIWLHLLQHGRTDAKCLAVDLGLTEINTHQLMRNMAATGSVRRFPRCEPGWRIEYAIDPTCRVPRDVTLADLLAHSERLVVLANPNPERKTA